jgi:hypothetical protein
MHAFLAQQINLILAIMSDIEINIACEDYAVMTIGASAGCLL